MKLTLKIVNGYITPATDDDIKMLQSIEAGYYTIDIKTGEQRTALQNRSLYLYFKMLSDLFNEQGQTIPKVLRVETKWTPEAVKELLWRPIMKHITKKKSTSSMTTKEVNEVYEVLSRALAQKLGIDLEFPHY